MKFLSYFYFWKKGLILIFTLFELSFLTNILPLIIYFVLNFSLIFPPICLLLFLSNGLILFLHFCKYLSSLSLSFFARIGLVGRVFANSPRDLGLNPGLSCHTKDFKNGTPCLTLSQLRYISRVKWSNPGKGVVPSPTPRCSSYWKGSLMVALDYGRHLYFTYYSSDSLSFFLSFFCTLIHISIHSF